jgi:hypothetical protein
MCAQFLDWAETKENKMRIDSVSESAISGVYSLRFRSLSTEFTSGEEGFRKSGSIYPRSDLYETGFSDGKIRTLFRMNSSDPSSAWAGAFFLASAPGIGTRLDETDDMYQVSNKGGTLIIEKFEFTIPTLLLDTGFVISQNAVYGIEVEWEFDIGIESTTIKIRAGTSPEFIDLTLIGSYTDSIHPHQFSVSEGLFAQTITHDDSLSYTFDKTSVIKVTTI